MFRGQVNPVTGRQEWVVEERDVESDDGDLSRELARSQYGDMLHDTARVGHSPAYTAASTFTSLFSYIHLFCGRAIFDAVSMQTYLATT